eukprot:TRINITY_DN9112_c0_g1_i1.p1 TRINITY_DN9112_c0_g1~~TRINITY_DN9112_c0_g1_i1.p1  ORF type:complete len:423 (-),score=98.70 TRINITY_DN9112_c0_g1_i1:1218-2486(-)
MELDIAPFMENTSKQGNTCYQLYSVLIHSGGAMGGHYYAMIQGVEEGKWFKFNDSSVTEISLSDIESMFGGCPVAGATSTNPNSVGASNFSQVKPASSSHFSTNAYMLFYRQKEEMPKNHVELPKYIQSFVEEENRIWKKEKLEFLEKRDSLPLQIFYSPQPCQARQDDQQPSHELHKPPFSSVVVHINKYKTLKDLTITAFSRVGLEGSHYDVQQHVRLRRYNPKTNTKGRVWYPKEQEEKTLDQLGVVSTTVLFLEVREPDTPFPSIIEQLKLSLIAVKECQDENEEPEFEQDIREVLLEGSGVTLGDLRLAAVQSLGCYQVILAQISPQGLVNLLKEEDDHKLLLEDYKLADGNSIHVQRQKSGNSSNCVIEKIMERWNNTIKIYYHVHPNLSGLVKISSSPDSSTLPSMEDTCVSIDQ